MEEISPRRNTSVQEGRRDCTQEESITMPAGIKSVKIAEIVHYEQKNTLSQDVTRARGCGVKGSEWRR
jgi:hypothetical protein